MFLNVYQRYVQNVLDAVSKACQEHIQDTFIDSTQFDITCTARRTTGKLNGIE